VNDPTAPFPAAFDFTDFARKIYLENPGADGEEFLLPALYG
jgi:hypothetical protein